jgi:Ca2+/Na+ antiporter
MFFVVLVPIVILLFFIILVSLFDIDVSILAIGVLFCFISVLILLVLTSQYPKEEDWVITEKYEVTNGINLDVSPVFLIIEDNEIGVYRKENEDITKVEYKIVIEDIVPTYIKYEANMKETFFKRPNHEVKIEAKISVKFLYEIGVKDEKTSNN